MVIRRVSLLALFIGMQLITSYFATAEEVKPDSKVQVLWVKPVEAKAAGYPCIDDEKCYLSLHKSGKVLVESRSLKGGDVLWKTSLPYSGSVLPLRDSGTNLLVFINTLWRGIIVALNKDTGSIEWEFKGKLIIWGNFPQWFNHRVEFVFGEGIDPETLYVSLGASRLLALDRRSGKKQWEINLGYTWGVVNLDLVNDRLYWNIAGLPFRVVDTKTGQYLPSPFSEAVHKQLGQTNRVYTLSEKGLFLREKTKEAEQIICYDLNSGKKLWTIEGFYFFPKKDIDNALYAVYQPSDTWLGILDQKYWLASIDDVTGQIYWHAPSGGAAITHLESKGEYVLTNDRKQTSRLMRSKDGSLVWSSDDSKETDNEKGLTTMHEEGTRLLHQTDGKVFLLSLVQT